MLYPSPWSRFELTTSVVIGTDCIGSCKSNFHTITIMTAPHLKIIKCVCTFNHIQNTSFLNVRTGFPTELGTRYSSTLTKCTRVIPRFTMTLRWSKMAARVQMFPSIFISKNAYPSNICCKRSTWYVQETREKLSASFRRIILCWYWCTCQVILQCLIEHHLYNFIDKKKKKKWYKKIIKM